MLHNFDYKKCRANPYIIKQVIISPTRPILFIYKEDAWLPDSLIKSLDNPYSIISIGESYSLVE